MDGRACDARNDCITVFAKSSTIPIRRSATGAPSLCRGSRRGAANFVVMRTASHTSPVQRHAHTHHQPRRVACDGSQSASGARTRSCSADGASALMWMGGSIAEGPQRTRTTGFPPMTLGKRHWARAKRSSLARPWKIYVCDIPTERERSSVNHHWKQEEEPHLDWEVPGLSPPRLRVRHSQAACLLPSDQRLRFTRLPASTLDAFARNLRTCS
jgi:hypothetical protein